MTKKNKKTKYAYLLILVFVSGTTESNYHYDQKLGNILLLIIYMKKLLNSDCLRKEYSFSVTRAQNV